MILHLTDHAPLCIIRRLARHTISPLPRTFCTCAQDIVSDTFVVVSIAGDDDLENYIVPYALFFGLGLAMYLCSTISNVASLHYLLTRSPATAADVLGEKYAIATNATLEISQTLLTDDQSFGSKGSNVAKRAVARRNSMASAKARVNQARKESQKETIRDLQVCVASFCLCFVCRSGGDCFDTSRYPYMTSCREACI